MKLKPSDLLDVATPKVITRLLSNPIAKELWIVSTWDAPFSSRPAERLGYRDDMLRIAKNPSLAGSKDIDPIAIAHVLVEYIDRVLSFWKSDSSDITAKEMLASLPLFVEMSKYLPHVNPADKYKTAFRGTEMSLNKLKQFMNSTSLDQDWVLTSIKGTPHYAYVGPKKNQFTYKPHRNVQSWSVSNKAAADFGSTIVATPIDTSFFFDPDFTKQYGYGHEQETIHFGKEPMKVILMVNANTFDEIKPERNSRKSKFEESSVSESLEISDEEGTLSIPI